MQILRTPDSCFADLTDFPWQPSYAEVSAEGITLRMAYVDAGPSDGPVVLLVHGEPSWSYLYRSMIGPLTADGFRVIAPDLIGFGRSDKPADRADYTYDRHVGWLCSLLDQLALDDITLFGQDWGGLLTLRIVGEQPDRFRAVIASNTGLPTGEHDLGPAFEAWRRYSQETPVFAAGKIVNGGTFRELSPAEVAAYDAPFPDETFKEGARQFPKLVPITPEHASVAENLAAWSVLETFAKPFVTAFSDGDEVTRGGEATFQARVPGAKGQPHVTLSGGHFLQEDSPDQIVSLIADLVARRAKESA